MKPLSISAVMDPMRLRQPFRISGYVFEALPAVVVTLDDGAYTGRGEAGGVYYTGDDTKHMLAEIERCRDDIITCESREALRAVMPSGGARNAVDAAMWELESFRAGKPVWQLAGLAEPKPLVTTFTLSADDPATILRNLEGYRDARAIKLKLDGDFAADAERVATVRKARPDVWMMVDANQGYSIGGLDALVGVLADHDVSLLEQPLPRGNEADLEGFKSPVPIAADESCLDLSEIPAILGRFQVLNIKLDKCGGLTEALLMEQEARRLGLQVMVGNMAGSSLAAAPGFLLAQRCDIVDLDGPSFLAKDRDVGVTYTDGRVFCPAEVWGASVA